MCSSKINKCDEKVKFATFEIVYSNKTVLTKLQSGTLESDRESTVTKKINIFDIAR